MRRIAITRKRLRGIPRRLRALARWPANFEARFPEGLSSNHKFVNYKLPVHQSLVDGRQATIAQRRVAAQSLINACANLLVARPQNSSEFRVVATICLPAMFSSEVCVYTDESYFREMTKIGNSRHGVTSQIEGRSLALEWGLVLPADVREFGIAFDNMAATDPEDQRAGEYWFYGEV